MKNAKVFIVETHKIVIKKICEILRDSGHEIVLVRGEIYRVEEAIKSKKLNEFDIALIDKGMQYYDTTGRRDPDGKAIERIIRRAYPHVKTIIFSLSDLQNNGVDFNLCQPDWDKLLIETIEKL